MTSADDTPESISSEQEKLELISVDKKPLYLNNKLVYYKGFMTLTDDEKARVLLGFLASSNDPDLYNHDFNNASSLKEKHEIKNNNMMFKLKFYGISIIVGILLIMTIVFFALFAYTSLDKGVLDENGTMSGIINTLKDVLTILFTDPTTNNTTGY